jgi:hypothetical protein
MTTTKKAGTMFRGLAMAAGLVVGISAGQATADTTVTAVDFGMVSDNCGVSPVYAGTFDGTSGFVAMEIGNCGTQVDVSIDIGGGATFSFANVTGWNNTDTDDVNDIRALTGDQFFSNWEGSGPVSFSFDGLSPDDILVVDFADRKGGEAALVTFDGVDTLVDGVAGDDGVFTNVGVVTGSSSYSGSFTGPNGDGEGNLCGARFTVISAGKGSGPVEACCFGTDCWEIGANDCLAAGGAAGGKGSVCDVDACAPPELLDCCVEGEGLPGCLDVDCANAVCVTLPDCCNIAWDADCATAAIDMCNDCNGTTDIAVTALDFGQAGGCSDDPVYSGFFDATGGFKGMTISDCCAVENPEFDLGNGVTLQFFGNSGWNNTDGRPTTDTRSLTGDHFFSSGCDAQEFVQFEVRNLNPCDTLVLEFVDRRGGERAQVTFEGVVTQIDAVGDYENDPPPAGFGFTDVSDGGVTGKDIYMGEFTGYDGNGEGNLSGAKIVIIPGDPNCGDSCNGDFNDDGIVNGADFGSLVASWGACAGCPEDLNGDDVVDGADVGLFVALWGPCL